MASNAERTALANNVLDLLLAQFKDILSPWTDAAGKQHPPIATPTDRATIARFLKDNGYHVDESKIPKDLTEMVAAATARRKLASLPEA